MLYGGVYALDILIYNARAERA